VSGEGKVAEEQGLHRRIEFDIKWCRCTRTIFSCSITAVCVYSQYPIFK